MKLTKAQRANLEHVRLFGEAKPRSNSGYWCRRHGLSEFVWLTARGERMRNAEWAEKFGAMAPIPQEHLLVKVVGEHLTPAGLAALREGRDGR